MTWTIPLFVWRCERKSKFWNWQHKNFKMNFSDFIWPAVSTCVRSGCSTTSWHHRVHGGTRAEEPMSDLSPLCKVDTRPSRPKKLIKTVADEEGLSFNDEVR